MREFKKRWGYWFVLLGFAFILPLYHAGAASVSLFTDSLSDSRPTELANHVIKFKMDTGTTVSNAETMTLKFNGFTAGTGTLALADFAVAWDADGAGTYTALTPTTDYTIATVNAGADPTVTIAFTSTGASAIGTNKYIQITFTNGANKLPNPSAGSYTIDLGGTFGDTGQLQVAIIGGVTTTATISASLSVTVAQVADTETVNGQDLDITSTAATVPFGIMTVNVFKAAAHDITVSTNAGGGYTTTIRKLSGTGTDDVLVSALNNIDGFIGSGSATNAAPEAWADGTNPSGSTANVNTGWYGYTTTDTTLGVGTASRFSGNKWAPFDSTAYEVMYAAGPVNADVARIGHMLEANALQPQGSYTGVIEYISTAIF